MLKNLIKTNISKYRKIKNLNILYIIKILITQRLIIII
jgi:hypothetical protein